MSGNTIVWKPNLDNAWRLYRHSDYKLKETEPPKEGKDGKEAKAQQYSPFSFTKLKPMTKGSVVCTSKGYGLVQSFNENKKTITVKIEGQVVELAEEDVMNEVPLNVVFIKSSVKTEEVMYIPISSTINEMVEKLENSLSDQGNSSISLFFQGKELEFSTETLEKLKILPNSKLLGLVQPRKPLSLHRFTLHYKQWNLVSGNIIGISFMPSKNIRVIGFAVYKMTQGTLVAEATMCTGESIKGDVLCTKSISVGEGVDIKDTEKIMWSRPYSVKAGEYVTIFLTINGQCSTNYGSGGKQQMEGEGDITMTFKLPTDLPSHLNSIDNGQFPEFYYYA